MPTETAPLSVYEIREVLARKDLSDDERQRLLQLQKEVIDAEKSAPDRKFTEPRFLLATITKGLGIPEVTIRNWLTRNQIDLGASEAHLPNKKRRFSVRDVLVIATCFHLSRHGVPVSVFALVYNDVIGFARMFLSGRPTGVINNPIGVLWNDGEWKLTRHFDSGPFHVSDVGAPAIAIIINYEKIAIDTLTSLGVNVYRVTAADADPEA